MKVIDLLNKITNGEEMPKRIKYDGEEYKITKVLLEDNNYWFNYINEDMECIFPINTNHLNDEVEIIEENKKIEKLEYYDVLYDGTDEDRPDEMFMKGSYSEPTYIGQVGDDETNVIISLIDKINEIIDYINKEKK